MAGTTVFATEDAAESSCCRQTRASLNLVIADLEKLRAAVDTIADKLDSDQAVTDSDYATSADVATAAELLAFQVKDRAGNL